jgi:hypothetical protein
MSHHAEPEKLSVSLDARCARHGEQDGTRRDHAKATLRNYGGTEELRQLCIDLDSLRRSHLLRKILQTRLLGGPEHLDESRPTMIVLGHCTDSAARPSSGSTVLANRMSSRALTRDEEAPCR